MRYPDNKYYVFNDRGKCETYILEREKADYKMTFRISSHLYNCRAHLWG